MAIMFINPEATHLFDPNIEANRYLNAREVLRTALGVETLPDRLHADWLRKGTHPQNALGRRVGIEVRIGFGEDRTFGRVKLFAGSSIDLRDVRRCAERVIAKATAREERRKAIRKSYAEERAAWQKAQAELEPVCRELEAGGALLATPAGSTGRLNLSFKVAVTVEQARAIAALLASAIPQPATPVIPTNEAGIPKWFETFVRSQREKQEACKHGHPGCSEYAGGACLDEILHRHPEWAEYEPA